MKTRNLSNRNFYIIARSEESCQKLFSNHIGLNCPNCPNQTRIWKFKDGKHYKCSVCKKRFTIKMNTPMEHSNLSFKIWVEAINLFTNSGKSISTRSLAAQLRVTQKTAWHMLHRIRKMTEEEFELMKGTIECDETYVGGKNKNRHFNKKVKNSQGRSFKDKTPVLGFYNRETKKVRTFKISDVKGRTLKTKLLENIHEDSIVMTDEWNGYNGIGNYFAGHGVVFHGRGQYVDGECYTNSMEGHWGRFKRTLIGIHHNVVSRKYLDLYCLESDFRQNHKDLTNIQKFKVILRNCYGKTLSYKALLSSN